MNSYELSRIWFDWCFENPEKISPNHSALYFFAIEHCNRLAWKPKFGLPTEMAKEAIGIKSYKTYIKTLNDLVDWGFIKMIEKSKNQYSSNIVALVKNDKALDKALDKAIAKASKKRVESNDSIDKPINKETIEQINKENVYRSFLHLSITNDEVEKLKVDYDIKTIDSILDNVENYKENKKYVSLYLTAKQWLKKEPKKSTTKGFNYNSVRGKLS